MYKYMYIYVPRITYVYKYVFIDVYAHIYRSCEE